MVYTIFTKPVLFFYMSIKTTLSTISKKHHFFRSLFYNPPQVQFGRGGVKSKKRGGGSKKSKNTPQKASIFDPKWTLDIGGGSRPPPTAPQRRGEQSGKPGSVWARGGPRGGDLGAGGGVGGGGGGPPGEGGG